LVLLVALVLAHKFLPAGRRSLRDIAPGILLTFALWIAASIAFGSYLADFARNYVTTYAGLASVMIALVFLYMIASIFIFGGELNVAILRAKRKRNGRLNELCADVGDDADRPSNPSVARWPRLSGLVRNATS
jgi:membrane protein